MLLISFPKKVASPKKCHEQLVQLAGEVYFKDGDVTIRYEPRKHKVYEWARTNHQLVCRLKRVGAQSFPIVFSASGDGTKEQFLLAYKAAFDKASAWAKDIGQDASKWQKGKKGWVKVPA